MNQNKTIISIELDKTEVFRYILFLDSSAEILHSHGMQSILEALNHLANHFLQSVNDQTQPE